MSGVPENTGISGIIEGLDRLRGYFNDYNPNTKSVKYNYKNESSEMTIKVTIPDSLRRNLNSVTIPVSEGYEVKEMYSGDLNPVHQKWERSGGCWVLDPSNLPPNEEYIVKMVKHNVEPDKFDKIIDIQSSKDSVADSGIEQHWVNARIVDMEHFEQIYRGFEVNNIQLSVNVGVHKCFSTAIPNQVTDMFERTRELLQASSRGERGNVTVAHRRRHQAQQDLNMSEREAAEIIRSLAKAENVGNFLTIDEPFKRQNIEPTTHENALPAEVGVDVSTDLSLEREAAAGNLEFNKEGYTEYLEEETEDIL